MDVTESVVASKTITEKQINQDYHLTGFIPRLNCNVLIVADGIGSFYKSEVAAKFVSNNLLDILHEKNAVSTINWAETFLELKMNLKKYVQNMEDTPSSKENAFGTTLICCVETDQEYTFAYVGNGAIFHIRGDFNTFSERVVQPWNSINLLNPHSIEIDGKNAMYRFISPDDSSDFLVPSVVRISKDRIGNGEIIMICTDGVYSYDEVQMGRDSNGQVWISGEQKMNTFYSYLKQLMAEAKVDSKTLEDFLELYFQDLKAQKLLDDDATMAVLVSPSTLDFQYKYRNRIQEKRALDNVQGVSMTKSPESEDVKSNTPVEKDALVEKQKSPAPLSNSINKGENNILDDAQQEEEELEADNKSETEKQI